MHCLPRPVVQCPVASSPLCGTSQVSQQFQAYCPVWVLLEGEDTAL